MPTAAPRPCVDCRRPTNNTRCVRCAQAHAARRDERRPDYGPSWRAARAAVIQAWIDQHGLNCPGYRRDPHPAADLTGDHMADGTIGVLCRSCNSRRGAIDPVYPRPTPAKGTP
jgi:hypothetical protein